MRPARGDGDRAGSPAGIPAAAVALRHDAADGTRWDAVLDRLGGGLCAVRRDGVPLLEERVAGHPAPHGAGAVLFPWPNRVRDARWTQRGVTHQLPVTEPTLGHANHGLVLDGWFEVSERSPSAATLAVGLAPRPGYPFDVGLTLAYELGDDGLTVAALIRNTGAWEAPVALGFHPYLRTGDSTADDLALRIEASRVLVTDDRLIPTGSRTLDGGRTDLRQGPRLGARQLNDCYSDLRLHGDHVRADVIGPAGQGVRLWADPDFGYLQVYTCPAFTRTNERQVRALAVEPMTAPADALNSGVALRWLAPGDAWALSWGLAPLSRDGCR